MYIPCSYTKEREDDNFKKLEEEIKSNFRRDDKVAILTTAQHSNYLKVYKNEINFYLIN